MKRIIDDISEDIRREMKFVLEEIGDVLMKTFGIELPKKGALEMVMGARFWF